MKRKVIDVICSFALLVIMLGICGYTIFQPNRPTVSEEEKRELATFPEFNIEEIRNGEYFSKISTFISDTFPKRDELIKFSREIKSCFGFNLGDNSFVIIDTNNNETQEEIDLDIPEIETESTKETEKVVETETETSITYPNADSFTFNQSVFNLSPKEEAEIITTFEPDELNGQIPVTYSPSNGSIVAVIEREGRYYIRGINIGSSTITAWAANGQSCQCIVNVKEKAIETETKLVTNWKEDTPDFLSNGLVYYQGAVYASPYYGDNASQQFAQVLDYYSKLFPNSRISAVIAPLSSYKLDLNTFGAGRLRDQNAIIEKDGSWFSDTVHLVNTFPYLYAHKEEYLYFKSDHHWTNRGAYYAYQAFCESTGLPATPIENMEEVLLSEAWQGTMYAYTKDERVKQIYDQVYAYMPTKANTMTIYYADGSTKTYNSCIVTSYHNYYAFIASDNAYTVINVPSNPQDMNCLVFKDSYGNAFVPYLCENYGNIIVVDPRKYDKNIYDMLKDYPLRDILFVNNIYNPNNAAWARMLLSCVK